MPNIFTINGAKVSIYKNDHLPPHIHIKHGEYEAAIDLNTVSILEGKLPKNTRRWAMKWVSENRGKLQQKWESMHEED